MTIELKVYDNGDHTCLVWLPSDEKAIPDCRGFTIHRTLKPNGGGPAQDSYLHGFVGFSDADKLDPTAPWKFPLQRYMWWDYLVDPGDVVQYSVVPVVGPDQDRLSLSLADASAQTPPMTITGQASAHICAYFNKGIVSAQWVRARSRRSARSAKLDSLIAEPGNALRNALGGLLRPQLLDLLDDVKKNGGEIYAALYELNDPELIPRLVALGQKCHLILANGAFNSKKPDENSTVRAQLRGKVDLHDRLVGQGHFAHNKFVVACDSAGKPQRVLSGSTNWTMTGLCTQANNGIVVDDPNLGAFFINQWNLLKAAGSAYPAVPHGGELEVRDPSPSMAARSRSGSRQPTRARISTMRASLSTAQSKAFCSYSSIRAYSSRTTSRSSGRSCRTFWPGISQGTPNYDGGLYIHGVVNQEIAGLTTQGPVTPGKAAAVDPANPSPVKLYASGKTAPIPVPAESMVPKAIKDAFHAWASEVMNQGVHVHSKVIVVDPFGKKPVVITGSHNLGYKASTKNDDNMMIVEGNAPLAAVLRRQYHRDLPDLSLEHLRRRPRQGSAECGTGPVDNATWQDGYLVGDELAEIKFWLGEGASAPAAGGQPAAAPASGGSQVRAATATGPSPHAGKAPRPSASARTAARRGASARGGAASVAKRPPRKGAAKRTLDKRAAARKPRPAKRARSRLKPVRARSASANTRRPAPKPARRR